MAACDALRFTCIGNDGQELRGATIYAHYDGFHITPGALEKLSALIKKRFPNNDRLERFVVKHGEKRKNTGLTTSISAKSSRSYAKGCKARVAVKMRQCA